MKTTRISQSHKFNGSGPIPDASPRLAGQILPSRKTERVRITLGIKKGVVPFIFAAFPSILSVPYMQRQTMRKLRVQLSYRHDLNIYT